MNTSIKIPDYLLKLITSRIESRYPYVTVLFDGPASGHVNPIEDVGCNVDILFVPKEEIREIEDFAYDLVDKYALQESLYISFFLRTTEEVETYFHKYYLKRKLSWNSQIDLKSIQEVELYTLSYDNSLPNYGTDLIYAIEIGTTSIWNNKFHTMQNLDVDDTPAKIPDVQAHSHKDMDNSHYEENKETAIAA